MPNSPVRTRSGSVPPLVVKACSKEAVTYENGNLLIADITISVILRKNTNEKVSAKQGRFRISVRSRYKILTRVQFANQSKVTDRDLKKLRHDRIRHGTSITVRHVC